MKKILSVLTLAAVISAGAREANLVNNSTFVHGMKCWKHTGAGTVEKRSGSKGVFLSGGVLAHYLDLGNLEHSQPDCAAPAGREFRFRVNVKGQGTLQLGVRARLMYGGNALEFAEVWSDKFKMDGSEQTFDFEAATTDPDAVFHDKLMIKPGVNSQAQIISTSFYYLDKTGPEITFSPAAAAVRPGETVTVTVHSSQPHLALAASLYPGQFAISGYFPAKHWEAVCDAKGEYKFTFTVPYEAQEGARFSVLDRKSGVKANFFATILPEKALQQYRDHGKKLAGKQHILFLGDSLSDYDRGRNYISIAGCFMPDGFTIRNCGVGGDTLLRIWQRMNGQKTTRNYMYDRIFEPNPEVIFIFAGANDSKVLSRSGYRKTYVPEEEQLDLWDKIVTRLKKQTGARIVLITSPDSYLPYQKALNLPLKAQNLSHSFFGLPEFHDRFNLRLKQIAAKHGLDVIDFAAAVRQHPDPQLLYVQDDGVHMSLKGHQFLAGEVLRYLADGRALTESADKRHVLAEKLSFSGSDKIRLLNSGAINAGAEGLTVIVPVKPLDSGTDLKRRTADALDMYVFKDRQFFLGRYGDRLYANFHDGTRYCGHTMSKPGKFPEAGKWSQAAAVFKPLAGGYAVMIYLNGEMVGKKEFTGKMPQINRNQVELGAGWGGAWHFRGEINGVLFVRAALSDVEIKEIFNKWSK